MNIGWWEGNVIQLRVADDTLPSVLRQIVDYRKSGLSLNHVVGCPLDCGYCVRHLFDNYDMKKPHLGSGPINYE